MPSGYNIRAHVPRHQQRLLQLYGQGQPVAAIAQALDVGRRLVDTWLSDLQAQLALPSRQALRRYAASLAHGPEAP